MRITKLKELSIALVALLALSTSCSKDATNDDITSKYQPLWEAAGQRNKIVTISDLHLGIDDKYSENVENRKYLIDFLQRLQATKDVRELVIIGDFLDEWFLPYSYTEKITDEDKFYRDVIKNNQSVIDEFKNVVKNGIKLVYVPGNHDLTLKSNILSEAIPGITLVTTGPEGKKDPQGLGTYYTGDRKEIAIEHGHRYDAFSAPDCLTNEDLCGNKGNTILPAGFFYAINAASWVLEGYPTPDPNRYLPEINSYKQDDAGDQLGAWTYYRAIAGFSKKHTPKENVNDKTFKMHFAGFDADFSYMDFFPQMQSDSTISAKLFPNIQRTWAKRQELNNVTKPTSFTETVQGTLVAIQGVSGSQYLYNRAKDLYLNNKNENIDVVVFGHTHINDYKEENGKYYVNDGTWIDHQPTGCHARTFVIITTGAKDKVGIYSYEKDGNVTDITADVIKTTNK